MKYKKEFKAFIPVPFKELVVGKKYYDLDDLDYGEQMEFVKRTPLYVYMRPHDKTLYNANKKGLLRFSRVILGLNVSFYEHRVAKIRKLEARYCQLNKTYYDSLEEATRSAFKIVAVAPDKVSVRKTNNVGSDYGVDENGLVTLKPMTELYELY